MIMERRKICLLLLLQLLLCEQVFSSHHEYVDSGTGTKFELSYLYKVKLQVDMQNPKNAKLEMLLKGGLTCLGIDEKGLPIQKPPGSVVGCLSVPGLPPTVTALTNSESISLTVAGQPQHGISIKYGDGEICDLTKKPRTLTLIVECDSTIDVKTNAVAVKIIKAWEGKQNDVCNYFLKIKAPSGCAIEDDSQPDSALPPMVIEAVTGCVDTEPKKLTKSCPISGGATLHIHGQNFPKDVTNLRVMLSPLSTLSTQHATDVEKMACESLVRTSRWLLTCKLPPGEGTKLTVEIVSVPGHNNNNKPLPKLVDAVSYALSPKMIRDSFSSFTQYGVGGLDDQIYEVYRRVFMTRTLPPKKMKALGIGHVKGVLLYGPPGTGKTLLARTIGKLLDAEENVVLINTPDIMQKYLGESEKVVKSYFEPALTAYQKSPETAPLHILIFDEIDAVSRSRGQGDGSAASVAYDSVVNALLTQMDGLTEVPNVVVFGMTNRKELIDEALLRPGRFEVQIEVSLPNEEGRRSIFSIHLRSMAASGMLTSDVDVNVLAAATPGFTGADIAGAVRHASSFAIDRYFAGNENDDDLIVCMDDILRALDATLPTNKHTNSQGTLSTSTLEEAFASRQFHSLGDHHRWIVTQLAGLAEVVLQGTSGTVTAVDLHGIRGTGKTAIAVHLAATTDFKFVKFITAEALVLLSEQDRVLYFHRIFTEAYRAKSSLVVLDGFDQLIDLVAVENHMSYTRRLFHALTALIRTTPPPQSRVLVVATNTIDSSLRGALMLDDLFTAQFEVLPLYFNETVQVMRRHHIHVRGDATSDSDLADIFPVTIQSVLHAINMYRYTHRHDHEQKYQHSDPKHKYAAEGQEQVEEQATHDQSLVVSLQEFAHMLRGIIPTSSSS
eukprot:m.222273 g.222273  ORF g.222273 m.222273 type:complete len:894 (+) comp33368_c0_seq4:152-2833(+)